MTATYRGKPILAPAWRRHASMTDHAHVMDLAGVMQIDAMCGASSDTREAIDFYDHAARRCRRCDAVTREILYGDEEDA